MKKNRKWLWTLAAMSMCFATAGTIGVATLKEQPVLTAHAAYNEIAQQDITSLWICNSAKGSAGLENSFNFNGEEVVQPGTHKKHQDSSYWAFDTSTTQMNVSFQMEFSDWGDDGWFGFSTAGQYQLRIYNHKISAVFTYGDYVNNPYEVSFPTEITSGWHTINMLFHHDNAGDNANWEYTVTIDGAAYTTNFYLANWGGNSSDLINNTGVPVKVLSTTKALPKDITQLDICDIAKGQVGAETAFNFNQVATVIPGAHFVHENGNGYWKYDQVTTEFDVSFQMFVGDWAENGWFGFKTAGQWNLQIFKDKIQCLFDYNQASRSTAIPTLTNGWHDIRLAWFRDSNNSTVTWILKVYIDDAAYVTAIYDANWGGNNVYLMNQTGIDVGILTSTKRYIGFVSNGGSEVANVYTNVGASVNELPTPSKAGYTFDGWYTTPDYAEEVDSIASLTKNTVLYAKWTINNYTAKVVRADGNEETVNFTIEDRAEKLAAIALTANNTQYTYAWATALPSELALNNDQVFTETRTVNNYTVTFDVDGGSAVEAQTVPYGTPASELANFSSTKEGYTFAGWTLANGVAIPEVATVTENIAVKASWTIIEYTVTFKNGDEVVGTATYTVEDKDIEVPTVPEKEGYTGAWESYELTIGDVTVNVVYTEETSASESEESTNSLLAGCFGSVSGICGGIVMLGAAALALIKKKED